MDGACLAETVWGAPFFRRDTRVTEGKGCGMGLRWSHQRPQNMAPLYLMFLEKSEKVWWYSSRSYEGGLY